MPLDSTLKQNHVYAMVQKTWQGRQQQVTFVYNSSGTWSYVLQNVIFRKLEVFDVEQPDVSGAIPKIKMDLIVIADISINVNGLVYIAYTNAATALAVSTAEKYECIEIIPRGIIPQKTHWEIQCRRFRG